MSIKIERLNHVFVKEISEILATEIKDEDIHFVTITGCDISSDLSYCKIYYTVLNKEKKEQTQKALDRASSFIRGKISNRIDIRHTPELSFHFDESIENGQKIERIIDKIHEEK